MARDLTAAMVTALGAESGYADVWLLYLESSAGVLRFTSAAEDQAWDGNTWSAVGGHMKFDEATESEDPGAQRVGIELGGVDQTVIAVLLSAFYVGRDAIIYFGQIDNSTGAIVLDPIPVFTGLVNESWTVTEQQPERGPGSVMVKTAVVGEMDIHGNHLAVRTNVQSHQAMLDRAAIFAADTFFLRVSSITGENLKWGANRVRRAQPRPPEGPRQAQRR